MNRSLIGLRNKVDHMPLYNRSHAQNKQKNDEDIALSTHKKEVFLIKEVKSGDTLQSIALEYNVPISQLKRINNIHKENEIYARKNIKVPSNPLSLLLEKEYFLEPEKSPEKFDQPNEQLNCDIIVEAVNNSSVSKSCHETFTEPEQEKHAYSLIPTEETQESVALLSTTVEHKPNDVMSCSGADWGMSWLSLLCITLILGVGGPFIYVFWFLWGKKEKTEGS